MADKKVQPEKAKTPQEFANEYKKLCEKYGYRIVVNPAFIGRDDGTYSVVLQQSVGQLPKQNGKTKA